MNDLPRHVLTRIIFKHGRGICDAPRRVEALLRDLCGAHRREINIIIGALEERVAADLLAAGGTTPRDVLLARLAARLRDHLAYTPEAARWAVETWAVALGTMSEAELRERARAKATESVSGGAPPSPPLPPPTVRDAEPPTANSPRVHPQTPRVHPRTPQPPSGTTPAPARRPAQSPQASPPQTNAAPFAPTPRRTPTMPPSAPALQPPRQNVAPAPPAQDAPRRRGLTLRGCFIGFVLLIVLIVAAVLVVPAVIMILKEEQAQPSINDPHNR